jgi:peptidylprolyl isomerase
VGRKIGSRLLLSIPAAQAYGEQASSDNPLAGQALLFVVDVLGAHAPNASATGSVVKDVPSGFPVVDSVSGKEPKITSVSGVATDPARSALLIKGTGPTIDPTKALALQFVQTDTATGQQTQGSWGQGAEIVPAGQVLDVAGALKGQHVGSRAVAVTGAANGAPSLIVVIDVIGQY